MTVITGSVGQRVIAANFGRRTTSQTTPLGGRSTQISGHWDLNRSIQAIKPDSVLVIIGLYQHPIRIEKDGIRPYRVVLRRLLHFGIGKDAVSVHVSVVNYLYLSEESVSHELSSNETATICR